MAKATKQAAPATSVSADIEAINTRTSALTQRRAFVTAQILKIEGPNNVMFTPVSPETKARHLAAGRLLNGGFQAGKSIGEDLTDLADQKLSRLVVQEDAERAEATRAEWTDAQAQVAHCLLSLEMALKARDAVWEKRRPKAFPDQHPNGVWKFERLAARAGPSYRFLQNAVSQGWISDNDFKQALASKAGR